MRDDFPEKVKQSLARRVSYHCSNPKCRQLTSGPNLDETKATLIGIAAHITAASIGGPRYDKNLTQEERKSIKNGIWLCHNCSDMIDKDERRFTANKLHKWKELTENFIHEKISSSHSNQEGLFKELLAALNDLMVSKKISEVLPKLFELSIIHNMDDLNEICTREINGWYNSELPGFNESNAPKYRLKEVYLSPKGKIKAIGNVTAKDFLEELERESYAIKITYLFHEPIKDIEEYASKYVSVDEKLMNQEISEGNLNIGGEILDQETQIWFLASTYNSIESGLRNELSRKLVEKIKNRNI